MSNNELDEEFKKVAKAINDKIKEAAKSLKEANRMAKKAGLPGLTYGHGYDDEYDGSDDGSDEDLELLEEKMEAINVDPLVNEMDNAGWRSSSWGY